MEAAESPIESLYGVMRLDLEEDLVIGNKGGENYLFMEAADIGIDSKENIFVLDSGGPHIKKYHKDGTFTQTIGREGQGPGEFEDPERMFIDSQDYIYIYDNRKIKIFSASGEFVRNIQVGRSLRDFCIGPEGNIFADVASDIELVEKRAVVKMDSDGKIVKNIGEFSDVKPARRKADKQRFDLQIHHPYNHRLTLVSVEGKGIAYGYSANYRIFLIDYEGNPLLTFQKKEDPHAINRRQKEILRKKIQTAFLSSGRKFPESVFEEAIRFPRHIPFFRWIGFDDKQRLFVWRQKSLFESSEEEEFDLFDRQGRCLYRLKIPLLSYSLRILIESGFLYDIKEDEEIDVFLVRRLRIRNWDQIKDAEQSE